MTNKMHEWMDGDDLDEGESKDEWDDLNAPIAGKDQLDAAVWDDESTDEIIFASKVAPIKRRDSNRSGTDLLASESRYSSEKQSVSSTNEVCAESRSFRDVAYQEVEIRDPSDISYPVSLPIELALNEHPAGDICRSYGMSVDDLTRLMEDPVFSAALKNARNMLKKEGVSFKLKAKMQAEELLKTSWGIIHDPRSPHSVRADLIKSTVKWAGYDVSENTSVHTGSGFAININFSKEDVSRRDREKLVIDHE
ncbi:MAG: hypothetical protein E6R04_04185 [Spirochaetes bacterium]|nr:MAG: hypothetical protein E6R04_04185 [Spirochaetota bacterium]